MIGLFVLVILGLWTWFAIWAAGKLSQYFWRNAASQPIATVGRWLTTLILTALVILLPFWDRFIAYPKWQQMFYISSASGDKAALFLPRHITTEFRKLNPECIVISRFKY